MDQILQGRGLKDPKVTFGILSYDNAAYICAALDSILAMEKPFPYEVHIADDGSTDDTFARLEPYYDKFAPNVLRILPATGPRTRPEGTGSRINRNRFKLCVSARGEYLLVGDGDDLWLDRTFVRESVEILDRESTLAAGYHGPCFLEDGKVSPWISVSDGRISGFEYVRRGLYTHYGTFVFRNYYLRDYSGGARIGCDDATIQIWLATQGDFCGRAKLVYAYRQYSNSGWFKSDPAVVRAEILLVFDSSLRNCPWRFRLALLNNYRREFRKALSKPKAIETALKGKTQGRIIPVDFASGSLPDVFCRWSELSWRRHLTARLTLLWWLFLGRIGRIALPLSRRLSRPVARRRDA